MTEKVRKVIVRWWDGYLQVFEDVVEWRAGSDLLWIGQTDRALHIPLRQVRWFEPMPSDRAVMEEQRKEGQSSSE